LAEAEVAVAQDITLALEALEGQQLQEIKLHIRDRREVAGHLLLAEMVGLAEVSLADQVGREDQVEGKAQTEVLEEALHLAAEPVEELEVFI
jgi:hypothetical protein